jgi:hypothetical protein
LADSDSNLGLADGRHDGGAEERESIINLDAEAMRDTMVLGLGNGDGPIDNQLERTMIIPVTMGFKKLY